MDNVPLEDVEVRDGITDRSGRRAPVSFDGRPRWATSISAGMPPTSPLYRTASQAVKAVNFLRVPFTM